MLAHLRFTIWVLVVASCAIVLPAHAKPRPTKVALIFGTEKDYGDEIRNMESALDARGYVTKALISTDKSPLTQKGVIEAIRHAIWLAGKGGQLYLSLQCHGSSDIDPDWVARSRAGQAYGYSHSCWLGGNEFITTDDLKALVDLARSRGQKIVISDHGCEAGTTVAFFSNIASAQNVCVLSTTTQVNPGLTGFPAFSNGLHQDSVRTFEDLARYETMEVLKGSVASREFQKVYESGCEAESMRVRSEADLMAQSFGQWWLGSNILAASEGPVPNWKELEKAHSELLSAVADRCRRAEQPTSFITGFGTELQKVAETVAQDGDTSEKLRWTLAYMKDAGVPLDYDKIATLPALRSRIEELLSAIASTRMSSDSNLAKLDDEIEHLLQLDSAGPEYERRLGVIQALRAQALASGKLMGDQLAELSRTLAVFEELECGKKSSPCREIAI